ncbi:MAG TPA: hypothetical protein VGG90_00970 [Candidatus Dormibacteraeota bacterium]
MAQPTADPVSVTRAAEQPSNGHHWSPDRRWWWDGMKWTAAAEAPAEANAALEAPPQQIAAVPLRKPSHKGRNIAIGAGVLLLLAIGIGIGSAGTNNAQPTANVKPSAGASARTSAIATAQATSAAPSQHALAVAYTTVVVRDSNVLASDFGTFSSGINACISAGDYTNCQANALIARADVQSFQADVNANRAPSCLSSADTKLRTALSSYDTGLGLAIAGMTDVSASEITQGATDLQTGNTELDQATALVNSASCS